MVSRLGGDPDFGEIGLEDENHRPLSFVERLSPSFAWSEFPHPTEFYPAIADYVVGVVEGAIPTYVQWLGRDARVVYVDQMVANLASCGIPPHATYLFIEYFYSTSYASDPQSRGVCFCSSLEQWDLKKTDGKRRSEKFYGYCGCGWFGGGEGFWGRRLWSFTFSFLRYVVA